MVTGKDTYKVILKTPRVGCYYIVKKLSWKKNMIQVNKIKFKLCECLTCFCLVWLTWNSHSQADSGSQQHFIIEICLKMWWCSKFRKSSISLKMMKRCFSADFSSFRDTVTIWLPKGFQKQGLLCVSVTTSFRVNNFRNI